MSAEAGQLIPEQNKNFKVILTSNGVVDAVKKPFLEMLGKPASEASIAFITTAAYGEPAGPEWNAEEWLAGMRTQLNGVGVTKIEDIDIKDMTQSDVENKLSDKDVVFVNGGNTYYLMFHINRSGFDKEVYKFLQKGGIYFGVSAGSIVTGPDIKPASWAPADMNLVKLTDFKGLNLVNFLIHPHFDVQHKAILDDEVKQTQLPVVALTNDQGIIVRNGELRVVGGNEKYFLNDFKPQE